MIQGEIVKEYLRKFPGLSSRKIAELLMRDIPGEYKTEDQCRNLVRYYRGSLGKKNRASMTDSNYIPKIVLPRSEEKEHDPYVIPYDAYPIIAGGDLHLPYHDEEALELFIERAIEMKAKTMLLAGDWMDMYQASRFQHDPRLRNVKDEIAMFNSVLDTIKKALPKTKLIFKIGNHEARYDNYLMNNAPALYGLEELHLDHVLNLKKRGIDLVRSTQIIKYGDLNIIHGHEYVFSISNPVNAARGLFNRAKASALCFHHHQTSEHTEPTINGKVVTCWSVGCLCNLKPEYMPLNKWNLGFAEIYGDENGGFHVNNRRIVNYRLM